MVVSALVDLLESALAIARTQPGEDRVSVGVALDGVVPAGTSSKIGRRYHGGFDCYISLPADHATPRGWMRDPSDGCPWTSCYGATPEIATVRALTELLSVIEAGS